MAPAGYHRYGFGDEAVRAGEEDPDRWFLDFFRSGLPQPEIRIGIHLHIETVNQTCIFQGIGVNENTG